MADSTRPACPATRHNTVYAYTHHKCRCPRARQAKTRQEKKWRLRVLTTGQGLLTDPTGTARRLRALQRMGYSIRDLAARLNTQYPQIRQLLRGENRVHVDTRARVTNLYNQLSMTPGPSQRSRAHATRNGWAPPLAWDDDQIDNPTAQPRYDAPHHAVSRADATRERRDQTIRLNQAGLNAPQIARRLGVPQRTVQRDLARK